MTRLSEHDIAQLMTAATEGLAGHPDPGPRALAGLHRRRQRRTAAAMVAVAVSALAVLSVTSTGPRPSPGALTSAPAADPVRSSPYWRVRFTSTVRVPGRPDEVATFEQWLGHGRPGLQRTSSGSQVLDPYRDTIAAPQLAGKALTRDSVGGLRWDDMWSLPRTGPGLADWWTSHLPADALAGETDPVVRIDDLEEFALDLLHQPGPTDLHRAAVALIRAQPGVTATTGRDILGRAADVIVTTGRGHTRHLFLQRGTAVELQLDTAFAPAPHPVSVPGGQRPDAISLDRSVYTALGPADHIG